MNLYKIGVVELSLGTFYIVARNTGQAEEMVKDYLDAKDYGFSKDRVVESIENMTAKSDTTLLVQKNET